LFLKEASQDNKETRFAITSQSKVSFKNNGCYYFVGLSILDPSLFASLPINTYYELGALWREHEKNLTGSIYPDVFYDAGSVESYESLQRDRVFSIEYINEVKEFINQCGLL